MPERDQYHALSGGPEAITATDQTWPKPMSVAVVLLASAAIWALILLMLLV